jgi:hypothetical protein
MRREAPPGRETAPLQAFARKFFSRGLDDTRTTLTATALRAFTAVRTVLMTAQYFAGLMRGPKWLYLELTDTRNADMLVNSIPLSLTMAGGSAACNDRVAIGQCQGRNYNPPFADMADFNNPTVSPTPRRRSPAKPKPVARKRSHATS